MSRPWTESDLINLRTWVRDGLRSGDIARRLRRTKASVDIKASKLGIRFGWPPRAARPVARERRTAPGLLRLVRSTLPEDASAAEARGVAVYIARVELEMSPADAAAVAGLKHDATLYWAPKIEDRRDDPEFDSLIDRLAERAREMAA